jgi:hypothetical protein
MNSNHEHVHLLSDVLAIVIVYFDLLKEDHEYFPTINILIQKFLNLIYLHYIFPNRKLEQEIDLMYYVRLNRIYVQMMME